MVPQTFGHIDGFPESRAFDSRAALNQAAIHRPTQGGISGRAETGAESIVLSGGYEDDLDHGDEIVYTGHGGRDGRTGQEIGDQQFERGNAALARNKALGLPVRVVRGSGLDSAYAPEHGYRYDGLYTVDEYWHEVGRAGFRVWRYRLLKIDPARLPVKISADIAKQPPKRKQTLVMRIVRDTSVSRQIKDVYDFSCQVCGVKLETPAGAYAEGAHIRPLGTPHNGLDVAENILCLCPNHHVLLDVGAIAISEDMRVLGLPQNPRLHLKHSIDPECARYHREHFGLGFNS